MIRVEYPNNLLNRPNFPFHLKRKLKTFAPGYNITKYYFVIFYIAVNRYIRLIVKILKKRSKYMTK